MAERDQYVGEAYAIILVINIFYLFFERQLSQQLCAWKVDFATRGDSEP